MPVLFKGPLHKSPPPLRKSWHEAFGGPHTLTAFKSHMIPLLLSAFIWHLYAHSFSSVACQFRDDTRLLSLWPANLIYLDQLANSNYSPSEVCWLYAVTSTTSAIWLCWLAWRIGFEVFRSPNVTYVPNGTKILLGRCAGMLTNWVIGIIIIVWLAVDGFHTDTRIYGLSLTQSMSVNAFKVVFFLEAFLFFVAGLLVEFASLFLRYLFLEIQHQLSES